MFMARVVGEVWSTMKWPELQGLKLLLVRPYHLRDLRSEAGGHVSTSALVVAADIYGAGPGEDVIVAYGHAGRVALEPDLPDGVLPSHPIDAAIVAIVDHFEVSPETQE